MSAHWDIVVVGGGHAGCEAAAAAARLGRRVALLTFDRAHVGRLSCNPAIGGLAKGTLVRELDALGGLMGRAADATTIQFRRLNTRKGLAVQSSRAQVDIGAYPRQMSALLSAIEGLTVVEGEAAELLTVGGRVSGLALADGRVLDSPAVILTTGTFLGGLMHRGEEQSEGGRIGEKAAHRLSRSLLERGLRLGRLKTGTPPRLAADSIDWSALEEQSDSEGRFSHSPIPRQLPPVSCWIAYTNPDTHERIRASLHRSPMFTGRIVGTGPRYCPSIEDKVHRFAHRDRHQLFLEPESHATDRVYVSGLSTSLPEEVQRDVVRSIEGLEGARILQYGYAVEYDHADPRDLDEGLQHRKLPGLWLAGQVNGTSGYEEAAVQGFVAGVSAARGEPLALGRDQAYIGVLIDDLVTRGIGGEPYRMFSSRAEHRLLLREDNADRRLMPLGRSLGLIDEEDWRAFEVREESIARGHSALKAIDVRPEAAMLLKLQAAGVGTLRKPTNAVELLRRPGVSYADLAGILDLPELPPEQAEQVETEIRYIGYLRREHARAAQARRMALVSLSGVDFGAVPGLSAEVIERLGRARPPNLQSAGRLPGMTPAAVNTIAAWLARR